MQRNFFIILKFFWQLLLPTQIKIKLCFSSRSHTVISSPKKGIVSSYSSEKNALNTRYMNKGRRGARPKRKGPQWVVAEEMYHESVCMWQKGKTIPLWKAAKMGQWYANYLPIRNRKIMSKNFLNCCYFLFSLRFKIILLFYSPEFHYPILCLKL